MKWVKYHLNWAFVFFVLIVFLISILFIALNPELLIYWFILAEILIFILAAWVLKRKKRSLWWLFLVAYFWPAVLLLTNQSQNIEINGVSSVDINNDLNNPT